jgi:hypothetical protein
MAQGKGKGMGKDMGMAWFIHSFNHSSISLILLLSQRAKERRAAQCSAE